MKFEGILRFAERSEHFRHLITNHDIIAKFQPHTKWMIINSNETTTENVRIDGDQIILNDFNTIQMALRQLSGYVKHISGL